MAECWLGVVDWDKNYENVLDYAKGVNHFQRIYNHMNLHTKKPYHLKNVGITKINNGIGTIRADGFHDFYYSFNYIIFKNDNNEGWYYAFIDNVSFEAPKTTHINFIIDVWQTYCSSIKFKRSFVERMHIPKSQDTLGRWLSPEPFNFKFAYQIETAKSNIDFSPVWVLSTLSAKTSDDDHPYQYGGWGNYDEITGTFNAPFTSFDELGTIISKYLPKNLTEGTIDHRNDIIGISAIPKWVDNANNNYTFLGGIKYFGRNETVHTEFDVTVPNSLPCGYVPKNRKLLTSLAHIMILYNRNGLKQIIYPEYCFTDESYAPKGLKFDLYSKPQNNGMYTIVIRGYRDVVNASVDCPYSANIPVGYNENAGSIKQLNILTSGLNTIGSLVSLGTSVGGIASGNPTSALGLVASTQSVVNSSVSLANAFQEQTASIGGGSGNTLTLIQDRNALRFLSCSPLYDECKEIDDYLTTYGYAINEVITPSISNRSNWNYLKGNIHFTCNANEYYKDIIKNIFAKGVTVWHHYDSMLDYSPDNT